MGQERRKTPAIADRRADEHPFAAPRYSPLVPFQEPPAPASPVIAYRYGQWIGDAVEPLFVRPQYQRFPYFQEEAPASPVISFRYGQPVLADPTALVVGRHLPFPFFQEAVLGASLIEFRYGRWLGETDPAAPGQPRFEPQVPGIVPEPARPVIGFRRGQWLGDGVQPLIGVSPQHLPFPYFEFPPPAANPVIPISMRLLMELTGLKSGTIVSAPRFYPLILFSPEGELGPAPAGTVPVRYLIGQVPNVVPVETVLTSEAGVVPVREAVGPANVVPVRETATETPRVKVRKV